MTVVVVSPTAVELPAVGAAELIAVLLLISPDALSRKALTAHLYFAGCLRLAPGSPLAAASVGLAMADVDPFRAVQEETGARAARHTRSARASSQGPSRCADHFCMLPHLVSCAAACSFCC